MAHPVDVTSQIVRHQMLMDLAKAVKEQTDKHSQIEREHEETEYNPYMQQFHGKGK